MWKSSEFCDFSASWQCDHDPTFLSSYTVIQNGDEWSDTDDSVNHTDSSFITFRRNEHSCALEISCVCKPHNGISIIGVEVRSQVHMIELYSDTDGYLQTIKGSKKEEDGSFCCKAKLEKAVDQLNMKFMGLGQTSSVRIYRLHLTIKQNLEKTGVSDSSTGMIDLSKVRGFLHSMGDSAPEGGTKLLQAVEDYQQSQLSHLGRLSSALGAGTTSSDSSSVLTNILTMVNRSHDPELSNQNLHNQSHDTHNFNHNTKAPDLASGGPLAAMLMSMSRSDDKSQGDSGKEGMFAMLQNICGKVSKLRVAEHTVETGAENEQIEEVADTAHSGVLKEPEIGASNAATASSRVTDFEMVQKTIEQTVSQIVQSSEDKMMKYIDTRLDAMESRINQKLDSLIQLLQKNGHPLKELNADT